MRHPIVESDLEHVASCGVDFHKLAGKTILVTGANGFLPAYFIEALLYINEKKKLGIRVIGAVRNGEKGRLRFAAYRGRKDLRLLVGDASEALRPSGPVHWILHAASQASPMYYGTDPVGTLGPNIFGTSRLLELAREKGAAVLYFSSCEVYGETVKPLHKLREQDVGLVDPLHPRACYTEGKRMGETLCAAWHRQYGVHTIIIRIFHTYGPGMPLGDGRAFSDFVGDIVSNRDITVRGDGKAVRAYCYLADTTTATFTAMLKGAPGTAYNIGNDKTDVSILALARRLVKLFPEKKLRVVRHGWKPGTNYLPSPFPRFCPDISRLRALGWGPTHGIDDGFRRTVLSYL